MARLKQTVVQRDFSFMGIREDFLEGDDLDIRRASLRSVKNMRSLATRAIEQRPGTFFMRQIDSESVLFEMKLRSGAAYAIIFTAGGLEVVDRTGVQVYRETGAAWSDPGDVWFEPFGNTAVIGGPFGIYELTNDDGAWSLTKFAFTQGPGGELQQPYWSFTKDTTIRPGGLEGFVSVVASKAVFTPGHVGLRIRYNRREMTVVSYISPTQVSAFVVNRLPPSFRIRVQDASEFRVGDSVVGSDTNYQGIIVAISEFDIDVATLTLFEGPDVGEELSGPSASSSITSKTSLAPLDSPIWDEPLMSDVRGWPRSAAWASGRLFMMNFDSAPDVIAVSSSREYKDFGVGARDDDAIARAIGDNEPRWLHAINMGDVLLLSNQGTYYVPTRDNGILTPSTFNVVQADETSASPIRPVRVEDGVVFVEAGGETLCAALLDGNVYLKWSVRTLSRFHNHVIRTPVRLCGPSLSGLQAEKYVFVVNSDGTLAALSWQESIRDERIGFVPWETSGQFKSVAAVLGEYWTVVSRISDGEPTGFLERFSQDAYLDAAIEKNQAPTTANLTANGENLTANGDPVFIDLARQGQFKNASVDIYSNGWDVGTFQTDATGTIIGEPDFEGTRQIGLAFTCEVEPWPVELIESPRVGTLKARVLQMTVSVQNSLGLQTLCNSYQAKIGAHLFGDDLTKPPIPRTQIYRFSVFGNRDHPALKISRPRPGPLRILAIGQRVTA